VVDSYELGGLIYASTGIRQMPKMATTTAAEIHDDDFFCGLGFYQFQYSFGNVEVVE
jgi:hypothetical protein